MSINVKILAGNSPFVFLASCDHILTYTSDIKKSPASSKFRKISIYDMDMLFVPGAVHILLEIGYSNAENTEMFIFPISRSLADLLRIHQELTEYRTQILAHFTNSGVSSPGSLTSSFLSSNATGVSRVTTEISDVFWNQIVHQIRRKSEREFAMRLRSGYDTFKTYENAAMQDRALTVIPRRELIQRALAVMKERGLGLEYLVELFTIELLAWFKGFFKWVDPLPCSFCAGKTESTGMVPATVEEQLYHASRIENHTCTVCGTSTRFPRYNDPSKLLETRTGRCGEWANCFTLCCVAVGLDARYVLDWTDHVWTEVFSKRQGRWLHCDPCENKCDQPLLYDQGWGKKLTYVIAFSRDDIQDVTWRYVSNYAEVRTRRNEYREDKLARLLLCLRKKRRTGLPTLYKNVLTERSILELYELSFPRSSSLEELGGRTTGTLEWRQDRGELGATGGKSNFTPYTIIPSSDELSSKVISIRYSCVRDEYQRGSNTSNNGVIPGWASLAYEKKNLMIKVENDWKMTYIAMTEGCVKGGQSGSISWKLDLSSVGMVVDYVEVKTDKYTHADGEVIWTVRSGDICVPIVPGTLHRLQEFSGCTHVMLTAVLLAGSDKNNGWQHAQLFRQPLSDRDGYPLIFRVGVKPLAV